MGRTFGALALTNADFRLGVTMESLYDLTLYRLRGFSFEKGDLHRRLVEEVQEVKARLEDPERTCAVVRSEYDMCRRMFTE